MEASELVSGFLGHGEEKPSTVKETGSELEADGAQPAGNGCFDCNICLDHAAEPVVTLCGHLYCWPCIYEWLRLDGSTPRRCPVCKAALSQATLVPLYGRGYDSEPVVDAPLRPSVTQSTGASGQAPRGAHPPRRRRRHGRPFDHGHDGGYAMSSSSTTTAHVWHPAMSGAAIAVLPWVPGDRGRMRPYRPDPYPVAGDGDNPRMRRQEMHARRSLDRMSVFLLCCMALCLLVF